jgi:hypothetical protein
MSNSCFRSVCTAGADLAEKKTFPEMRASHISPASTATRLLICTECRSAARTGSRGGSGVYGLPLEPGWPGLAHVPISHLSRGPRWHHWPPPGRPAPRAIPRSGNDRGYSGFDGTSGQPQQPGITVQAGCSAVMGPAGPARSTGLTGQRAGSGCRPATGATWHQQAGLHPVLPTAAIHPIPAEPQNRPTTRHAATAHTRATARPGPAARPLLMHTATEPSGITHLEVPGAPEP